MVCNRTELDQRAEPLKSEIKWRKREGFMRRRKNLRGILKVDTETKGSIIDDLDTLCKISAQSDGNLKRMYEFLFLNARKVYPDYFEL